MAIARAARGANDEDNNWTIDEHPPTNSHGSLAGGPPSPLADGFRDPVTPLPQISSHGVVETPRHKDTFPGSVTLCSQTDSHGVGETLRHEDGFQASVTPHLQIDPNGVGETPRHQDNVQNAGTPLPQTAPHGVGETLRHKESGYIWNFLIQDTFAKVIS